jgi:hypothetical protein
MPGEACEDDISTFPTRPEFAEAAMTLSGIDLTPLIAFDTLMASSP